MEEIARRLHENRNIERAKSILEAAGYKVEMKRGDDLRESYEGASIEPFRPFTKQDWYGYAGAEKIKGAEPLIFSGDNSEIIISADVDESDLCDLQVYAGDSDSGYFSDPMPFLQALSAGKEAAALDDDEEKIIQWCKDNLKSF